MTPEFTAGTADLAPGGWLGHHRHEPAEMYYVLQGQGTLTIDGTEYAVDSGTAAYVPGNSEHGIRNTGEGLLRFFYVFAVGSFDQIEYRFTAEHKYLLTTATNIRRRPLVRADYLIDALTEVLLSAATVADSLR